MKWLLVFCGLLVVLTSHADDAPTDPLPNKIQEKIDEKGYVGAKEELESYIELNPNSYEANSALGKAKATEGDYSESIRLLEKARLIKDNNNIQDASIYNSIGWVKFLDGNPDEAVKDIETAIENESSLDPKVAEAAYNNLGIIYMHGNENEKAAASFEKAISEYNSEYAKDNLMLIEQLSKARSASEIQ